MEQKRVSHIAIIADGNGRWAKSKGLERVEGHKRGEINYERISRAMQELGVEYFTIYGFSTENWSRSEQEVSNLINLFVAHLKRYGHFSATHNFRLKILGSRENLTKELLEEIENVERMTANNTGLKIRIAFNYGGRDEIVRACRAVAGKCLDGSLTPDAVNERLFEDYLDTAGIPSPEIVIRTGGEKRLSNFLLWQLAYSELFFVDTYWPDFSPEELSRIIEAFQNRNRRFGGA